MADDAGRLNQVFAETSFLYGSNASFIEDLHGKWAADPASVSGEWRAFFDQLRDNADSVKASGAAGSWGRSVSTEPSEATGVFDGRWPAPKPDPKKPGAPAATAAATAPDAGVLAEAVRASLNERRIIERAKGLLMAHRNMREDEAYKTLRQMAMNQNRRLVDVAAAVLSLADVLPGGR